mmetsp:Transcript_6872/g.8909  ORF Transcript_6872/g.8909 Transcript_6872/m.8909 type:complete len:412 (+) Transcript_6872:84-1319(+)|eukprot:CAMPEP_0198152772 /NCGR_PEP_ID=MMETSP1443-20131203/61283_1 /TAXON_ID=186043 /ORGANISM="Entomoneis sp., Strain CCMP2396" /LENGTH=411 /DNA_ID=CAMNT_0043818895 /DNA_START=162 /DNA_END=1394 /DNA_ORIENTATION=-
MGKKSKRHRSKKGESAEKEPVLSSVRREGKTDLRPSNGSLESEKKTSTIDELLEQQPPNGQKRQRSKGNPFREKMDSFLTTLSRAERESFFSELHVSPERRGVLWMQQADLGEGLVDQYSWAVPNDACLKILDYFGPIVEVGCGANAYWCLQMKNHGIDVVGYDVAPKGGGRINKSKKSKQDIFEVLKGGPEVLSKHEDRTLFLCYPDENDDIEDEQPEDSSIDEPMSLGQACLQHYTGNYIVHVGEIFGDTLSMAQAPWGRSSSPMFQQQLAAEFHCILKMPLPGWLHVRDSLTVWKRSETCTIVFATEGDDEEEDDEVQYRHIPPEERLPSAFAAPYLAHLISEKLTTDINDSKLSQPPRKIPKVDASGQDLKPVKIDDKGDKNDKEKGKPKAGSQKTQDSKSTYECPW